MSAVNIEISSQQYDNTIPGIMAQFDLAIYIFQSFSVSKQPCNLHDPFAIIALHLISIIHGLYDLHAANANTTPSP
jgi:hypothetical protein